MTGPPDHLSSPSRASTTDQLFPVVYEQLRDLAGRRMARERSDLTLQTTALVHEVYVRLSKDAAVTWENPGHFFAAAAEAMRRILIERARRHAAARHGGGRRRIGFDGFDAPATPEPEPLAMLALDEALTELQTRDPDLVKVVMLRYFAGLSVEETASALACSPRTVKRDWSAARAWLLARMEGDPSPPASG